MLTFKCFTSETAVDDESWEQGAIPCQIALYCPGVRKNFPIWAQ